MNLIINGEAAQCSDNVSVSQLLVEQEVKMPDMVSVELNGEIVRRENFESTTLKENDKVEFLYYMGGGSAVN